jgi:hypothetical protein
MDDMFTNYRIASCQVPELRLKKKEKAVCHVGMIAYISAAINSSLS